MGTTDEQTIEAGTTDKHRTDKNRTDVGGVPPSGIVREVRNPTIGRQGRGGGLDSEETSITFCLLLPLLRMLGYCLPASGEVVKVEAFFLLKN